MKRKILITIGLLILITLIIMYEVDQESELKTQSILNSILGYVYMAGMFIGFFVLFKVWFPDIKPKEEEE